MADDPDRLAKAAYEADYEGHPPMPFGHLRLVDQANYRRWSAAVAALVRAECAAAVGAVRREAWADTGLGLGERAAACVLLDMAIGRIREGG
jgi:hypothetical protein